MRSLDQNIRLQIQEGAFYPYDDDSVCKAGKLKENAIYDVKIKKMSEKDIRSSDQNRLAFKWYRDLGQQGDQTASGYRAYCKLHHGVPLLRMHDEEFRAVYDSIIRPLDYEQKLALMIEPIDLPVTSRMSVEIMAQYMKNLSDEFLQQGFRLTKLEHLLEWLAQDEEKG